MVWQPVIITAIIVAASYLLGGIPWALIIGKLFYHVDVREHGSGNLGATNVLRALGAKAAIATLLLDAAKGAAAVGLAWWLVPAATYGTTAHQWAEVIATMASILGHSYSPYIGFKGGKGVATAAGALLILTPLAWPFLFGSWLIVILVFRIVSLASVIIAIEYPILCLLLYREEWVIFGFAMVASALVVWRHRGNIMRIIRGEESRVSFKQRGSAARDKGGS